jgi:hypothetical protein
MALLNGYAPALEPHAALVQRSLAQLIEDIHWWRVVLRTWIDEKDPAGTYPILSGRSIAEDPSSHVYCVRSDASGIDGRGGYHGHLGCTSVEYWSTSWRPEDTHIREVSMAAELYALLDFCRGHHCDHKVIIWVTDSPAAAFVILKGYTSVRIAQPILREIMGLADSQFNQLVALWIPREENEFADYLSHLSVTLNKPHVSGSHRLAASF